MKCPRCSGELKAQELAGIQIDRCATCGGTWFDKGEFDSIKGEAESEEMKNIESSPVDQEFTRKQEGDLTCPKCEVVMDSFSFQYSSGIKLDRCNICDGFWFDCGEIGAALGYLEAQANDGLSSGEVKALLDKGRETAKAKEKERLDSMADHTAVKGLYRLMHKLGCFVDKFNIDVVS
ncbi:MAG: zf-TFIIB domain-containing protein [bacterium]|nr:zf-TFIIB domain-containing protein [bacterium]